MLIPTSTDLTAILPTLILIAWALGLLLVALFISKQRHWANPARLGLIGVGVALLASVLRWGQPISGFGGTVNLDNYSLFTNVILSVAGMLTILLSRHAPALVEEAGAVRERSEYYPLLLLSLSGMILLTSANDLIILFISLELISIPLYILSGFGRSGASSQPSSPPALRKGASKTTETSQAAALKHVVLGAFASAFLIYGMALVYGGAGTTALPKIIAGATAGDMALVIVGTALILVGLAFKVGAVPFHMWIPDVYEGAPTPIAAFMSVGIKTAGLAALGRVVLLALPPPAEKWTPVVAVLAALTMTLGDVVALSQTNIKRMLTYSSIAQTGYLLMGVAALNERGLVGLLFSLLTYAFTHLGIFALLTVMARRKDHTHAQSTAQHAHTDLASYAGLAKQQPWLAAAMALFMFSLIGIPPTSGFVGKYSLFWAAVEADLIWLAVLGVLSSLISACAYLRVVALMYFDNPSCDFTIRLCPMLRLALILTTAVTLILGLWPGPVLDLVQDSVRAVLGQM
jgi:NADH-quinone oxidoreductase subunit N